jgi:ABC-2 type transport system ATP-binding protein
MITVEHVTKYYGAQAAVSDLTFTIERGEVVGLLGRNGAGKTTILRMLSGLLVPTSGRVCIAGRDLRHDPEAVRASIGFLPDTPPLHGEMTVSDYLRFAVNIKGVRAGADEKVAAALAATDLEAVRCQRIDTLSQGYRRRVGIAQAIVHEPALVLLDEPTASLDPVQVVQTRKLLRDLAGKHTVLLSSHMLAEIEKTCDRLLLLDRGRIVAEGTEQDLARRVSAGLAVELEVRGSATALDRALAGVAAVSRHVVQSDADGLVRARLDLTTDAREELVRALVAAGLGVRRLERARVDLEDIFMSLTGSPRPAPSAAGVGS